MPSDFSRCSNWFHPNRKRYWNSSSAKNHVSSVFDVLSKKHTKRLEHVTFQSPSTIGLHQISDEVEWFGIGMCHGHTNPITSTNRSLAVLLHWQNGPDFTFAIIFRILSINWRHQIVTEIAQPTTIWTLWYIFCRKNSNQDCNVQFLFLLWLRWVLAACVIEYETPFRALCEQKTFVRIERLSKRM